MLHEKGFTWPKCYTRRGLRPSVPYIDSTTMEEERISVELYTILQFLCENFALGTQRHIKVGVLLNAIALT